MLKIEIDREADRRWIAEVADVPGALAYGATMDEARSHAAAPACPVIADMIEHGEAIPTAAQDMFA